LSKYKPCHISFKKYLDLSTRAAQVYNLEKQKFISENWDRNELFEFKEELIIEGFPEYKDWLETKVSAWYCGYEAWFVTFVFCIDWLPALLMLCTRSYIHSEITKKIL